MKRVYACLLVLACGGCGGFGFLNPDGGVIFGNTGIIPIFTDGFGPGGSGDAPDHLTMIGTPTINGIVYVDGYPINILAGNALCINLRGAFAGGIGPFRIELIRQADNVLVVSRAELEEALTCFQPDELTGLSSGFYIIRLTDGRGNVLQWLIVIVVDPPSDPRQPVIEIVSPINNSGYDPGDSISFTVEILKGVPPFNIHWLFADATIVDVVSSETRITVLKSFALPNDTGLNFVEVTDSTGLKSEIQQVRVIID